MMRKLVLAFMFLVLLVSTIYAGPPPVKHSEISEMSLPSKHVIEGVPIYRQSRDECGPTSLSMVLNFYGKKFTKDDIAQAITVRGGSVFGKYTSGGTRPDQMESYVKDKGGCNIYPFKGKDPKKIKYWLAQGYPLIVLGVIPGSDWYRETEYIGRGHYIVLIGYDDENQCFFANDPAGGRSVRISYKGFEKFHSVSTSSFGPYYVLCIFP
jgi:uncharacterized protein YvpB